MTSAKKSLPAWVILAIISLVAGTLLGVTNALTEEPIATGNLAAAEAARANVMPLAASFEQLEIEPGAPVDNLYRAIGPDGSAAGFVSQITVTGYGGEIEVIVGMDADGTVTGISVGGPNFSETAGLGAKTKEPAFSEQFRGLGQPVVLKKDDPSGNVDAVTAATRSSRAIANGVQAACEYMLSAE